MKCEECEECEECLCSEMCQGREEHTVNVDMEDGRETKIRSETSRGRIMNKKNE